MSTRREVAALAAEMSRRRPNASFAIEKPLRQGEVIGVMRCPSVYEHDARAKLARMVKRGELGTAFNARHEGGQYVVEYTRLRDPRARAPRLAGWIVTGLSGAVGLGWLVWESRYVIAALAAAALAMFVGYVIIMSAMHMAGRCPGHHCPGCLG